MMRKFLVLLTFLLATVGVFAHDHTLPPGFALEENFITGLNDPTDLKIAPDGRIFIAEKEGNVRIVENGILLPEPFYSVTTQTASERGLDGIILDPDFDNNGYLYLFYTLPFQNANKVARVTAAGNTAVPGSEIELIRFDNMWASWHNGGGMAFDTTGKLIIGTGDGTGYTSSQDMSNTLGKILRINTDGTIPVDNPFFTQNTGVYRAILAYGIRNPYTMAASAHSGRIFFNDVGNNAFEEVNELIPGKNYGWYPLEGWLGNNPPPDTNYMDPIHVYDHDFGCAIVGATFYEPIVNRFPAEYFGKYFFMEYCEGKILYLDPDSFTVREFASGLKSGYNNIEASPDGFLYAINVAEGNLARISFQGANSPPLISIQPASQVVPAGDPAHFSVDATGDSLSYEWYLNGTLLPKGYGEEVRLAEVQFSQNQAEVYVKVFNPHGWVLSDTVNLTVVNGSRPTIGFQQLTPLYEAGDSIRFAALVTDPDQQGVPDDALTWKIDFHHDDHAHPALAPTSGMHSGAFFIETYGEVDTNVFYRVHLTARDSSGLSASDYMDILPHKVTLLFETEPPGVRVNIDGSYRTTPVHQRSVSKLNRTIELPPYAVIGDTLYRFHSWEDGSDTLIRTFSAENDTFQIIYEAHQPYFSSLPAEGNLHIYTDTGAVRQYYRSLKVPHIKENWDILNPFPWDQPPFPNNYWSAVWEGTLVAPVSDEYTFYLFHDGQVTLSVGDSVLLDNLRATRSLVEDTARIWLNAGDSLDIRLDYTHYLYLARVELDWSYSLLERHTVPFSVPQPEVVSPPPAPEYPADIFLFPNPSQLEVVNLVIDPEHYDQQAFEVEVFDVTGRKWFSSKQVVETAITEIPTGKMTPGLYLFRIRVGEREEVLRFVKM